jgi:flagellin-like protein
MKGVSAVIAVILILMITVALAATSYVWFSSVFSTVTTGGTEITEKGVTGIQTGFAIESARYMPSGYPASKTAVVIRNTGTVSLNMSDAAAYIAGEYVSEANTEKPSGLLAVNAVNTINVTNITGMGNICGKELKLSFAAGPPQTATIVCV